MQMNTAPNIHKPPKIKHICLTHYKETLLVNEATSSKTPIPLPTTRTLFL